jgi:hypothetical protein
MTALASRNCQITSTAAGKKVGDVEVYGPVAGGGGVLAFFADPDATHFTHTPVA